MPSLRDVAQVEGLDQLERNIKKLLGATTGGKQIKQVLYKAGIQMRDQAKRNAPFDPTRKKGTHLRDAIFVDWGNDSETHVLVGVRYAPKGAPHAHLIEFGHAGPGGSHTPAHPYFRPAISQTSNKMAEIIREGFLEVVEKTLP